jgi:hypothetical protein
MRGILFYRMPGMTLRMFVQSVRQSALSVRRRCKSSLGLAGGIGSRIARVVAVWQGLKETERKPA